MESEQNFPRMNLRASASTQAGSPQTLKLHRKEGRMRHQSGSDDERDRRSSIFPHQNKNVTQTPDRSAQQAQHKRKPTQQTYKGSNPEQLLQHRTRSRQTPHMAAKMKKPTPLLKQKQSQSLHIPPQPLQKPPQPIQKPLYHKQMKPHPIEKGYLVQKPPHPAQTTPNHVQKPPHPAQTTPSHVQKPPHPVQMTPNRVQKPPYPAQRTTNHVQKPPHHAQTTLNRVQKPPQTAQKQLQSVQKSLESFQVTPQPTQKQSYQVEKFQLPPRKAAQKPSQSMQETTQPAHKQHVQTPSQPKQETTHPSQTQAAQTPSQPMQGTTQPPFKKVAHSPSQPMQHTPKQAQPKSAKHTQSTLKPEKPTQQASLQTQQLIQDVSKPEEFTPYRPKYKEPTEKEDHLQQNLSKPTERPVKPKPQPLQSTEQLAQTMQKSLGIDSDMSTRSMSKEHKHEQQPKHPQKLQNQNKVNHRQLCSAIENLTLKAHQPRESEGPHKPQKLFQAHHSRTQQSSWGVNQDGTHKTKRTQKTFQTQKSKAQQSTWQVNVDSTPKTEHTQKTLHTQHPRTQQSWRVNDAHKTEYTKETFHTQPHHSRAQQSMWRLNLDDTHVRQHPQKTSRTQHSTQPQHSWQESLNSTHETRHTPQKTCHTQHSTQPQQSWRVNMNDTHETEHTPQKIPHTQHSTQPQHSKAQQSTWQVNMNDTHNREQTQMQVTTPCHSVNPSTNIHLPDKMEGTSNTSSSTSDKNDGGQETSQKHIIIPHHSVSPSTSIQLAGHIKGTSNTCSNSSDKNDAGQETSQKQITNPHHLVSPSTNIHLPDKIEGTSDTSSSRSDKNDGGQETSHQETPTQPSPANDTNIRQPGQETTEVPQYRPVPRHPRHRRRLRIRKEKTEPERETKSIESIQPQNTATQSTHACYSEEETAESRMTEGRKEESNTKENATQSNNRLTDLNDKTTEVNMQTLQNMKTDNTSETTSESIKLPQHTKTMIHPAMSDFEHVEKQRQHTIKRSKPMEKTVKPPKLEEKINHTPVKISEPEEGQTQTPGPMKTAMVPEYILQVEQRCMKVSEPQDKATPKKRQEPQKKITQTTKRSPVKYCKRNKKISHSQSLREKLTLSSEETESRDKPIKPMTGQWESNKKNTVPKEKPTKSSRQIKNIFNLIEKQTRLRRNSTEESTYMTTEPDKSKNDPIEHKVGKEHRESCKEWIGRREEAEQSGMPKNKHTKEKADGLQYTKFGPRMERRRTMMETNKIKGRVMEIRFTPSQMTGDPMNKKTDNMLNTKKEAKDKHYEGKQMQTFGELSDPTKEVIKQIPQNILLAPEREALTPQNTHAISSKLESCETTAYKGKGTKPPKISTKITLEEGRSGEIRDISRTLKTNEQPCQKIPDVAESQKTLPKCEISKLPADKVTELQENATEPPARLGKITSEIRNSLEKITSLKMIKREKLKHDKQKTPNTKSGTRTFLTSMRTHTGPMQSCYSLNIPVASIESYNLNRHKESHVPKTQYYDAHTSTDLNEDWNSASLRQNYHLGSMYKRQGRDGTSYTPNIWDCTVEEMNAGGDQFPEDQMPSTSQLYSHSHQKGGKDYIIEMSWFHVYKYYGQRKRLKQLYNKYERNQHQLIKQANKLVQTGNMPMNSEDLICRAKKLIRLKKTQETTLTAVVQKEKEHNQSHETLKQQLQNVTAERKRLLSEREMLQKEIALTRKEKFNLDARKCYQRSLPTQRQEHKGEYLHMYQHNLTLKLSKADEAIESNLKTLHSLQENHDDVILKKKELERITKGISERVKVIKRKLHKLQCLHNSIHLEGQITHRIKRLRDQAENLHLQGKKLKALINVLKKVPKERRYYIPTLIEALTDEEKRIISWSVTDQGQFQGPKRERHDSSEKYQLVASDVWRISTSQPKHKPRKTSTEPWSVEPLDTVPKYIVIRVNRQDIWIVTDNRTNTESRQGGGKQLTRD